MCGESLGEVTVAAIAASIPLPCLCRLQVCERFVTKECVNTRGADVCVKEQMRAMLAPDHPPASNLALRVGLGVGIPCEYTLCGMRLSRGGGEGTTAACVHKTLEA